MSEDRRPIISQATFVDMFEDECWGELYELMATHIEAHCKNLGLNCADVESWVIGFTTSEIPETKLRVRWWYDSTNQRTVI